LAKEVTETAERDDLSTQAIGAAAHNGSRTRVRLQGTSAFHGGHRTTACTWPAKVERLGLAGHLIERAEDRGSHGLTALGKTSPIAAPPQQCQALFL